MRYQLLTVLGTAFLFCITSTAVAGPITGPIRGVSFNALNVNIDGQTAPVGPDGNPLVSGTNISISGIAWLIDNINDDNSKDSTISTFGQTVIDKQLDNLLDTYQNAGVNWIRVLISANFFKTYCDAGQHGALYNPNYAHSYCNSYQYPGQYDPSTGQATNQVLFDDVNALLAHFNSGSHVGRFQVELTLSGAGTKKPSDTGITYECESIGLAGDTTGSAFIDTTKTPPIDNTCRDDGDSSNPQFDHPFGNAEEYLYTWIMGVVVPNNNGNIGMTELGATLRPCAGNICYGSSSAAAPQQVNNGEFIENIWAWEQATLKLAYPSLIITYETAATYAGTADPIQAQSIAAWANLNTPGLPYISMTIYTQELPGSPANTYESAVNTLLAKYKASANGIPLWIDEFGGQYTYIPAGSQQPNPDYSIKDAENSLEGFLTATTCQAGLGLDIPKVAWVGDDDLNTSFNIKLNNGAGAYNSTVPDNYYGLVDSFDADSNPIMKPQWNNLSHWYWHPDSAGAADGVTASAMNSNVRAVFSSCGITQGSPSFSIITPPRHGTTNNLNGINGAFTYTPNANFWGTDTLTFSNGMAPDGTPLTGIETIYVYNPALITVILN